MDGSSSSLELTLSALLHQAKVWGSFWLLMYILQALFNLASRKFNKDGSSLPLFYCLVEFLTKLVHVETAALLKRPRTPPSNTPTVDYQSADSEHLMKRARPGVQPVDEVKTVSIIHILTVVVTNSVPKQRNLFESKSALLCKGKGLVNTVYTEVSMLLLMFLMFISFAIGPHILLHVRVYLHYFRMHLYISISLIWSLQVNYAGPSHPQSSVSLDDLPKVVARSLNQGSCVMSMDFHPVQQTVLLGTSLHYV